MAVLLAYLLGSIPFGLLLGFAAGHDVRRTGSQNIGATNVWRVCGWKWGLACFVLDFLKGFAAVWLAAGALPLPLPAEWGAYGPVLAAVAAVLGHNFPVWLSFRGGKGVATSAGAVAGLMWLPFLLAIAVFAATVWLSRYLSLGSITASAALVAGSALFLPEPLGADAPLLLLTVLLMFMIIYRHRANISRIRAGTENRFPPPQPLPKSPQGD